MMFPFDKKSVRLPVKGYIIILNKILMRYTMKDISELNQEEYDFLKESESHSVVGYFLDGLEAYETALVLNTSIQSYDDKLKSIRDKVKVKPILYNDVQIDTSGLIPIDDKIIIYQPEPKKLMDNFNNVPKQSSSFKKLKPLGEMSEKSTQIPITNEVMEEDFMSVSAFKVAISPSGEYTFYNEKDQDITEKIPKTIREKIIKMYEDKQGDNPNA